jgi:hypothetical protein
MLEAAIPCIRITLWLSGTECSCVRNDVRWSMIQLLHLCGVLLVIGIELAFGMLYQQRRLIYSYEAHRGSLPGRSPRFGAYASTSL